MQHGWDNPDAQEQTRIPPVAAGAASRRGATALAPGASLQIGKYGVGFANQGPNPDPTSNVCCTKEVQPQQAGCVCETCGALLVKLRQASETVVAAEKMWL